VVEPADTRCGIVALAGRPNVGKSTLTNALCGGHVSIVSDKPQTTRRRVSGIANGPGWQLVLLDLPGFQRPRDGLTGRMQSTVDESLGDVDATLFVLDATVPPGAGDRFIAERVFGRGTPVLIALNKVDRLSPVRIGRAIEAASALGDFHALHPVSAATGDGVAALRDDLVALLPEGPPLYPTDTDSGDPLRLRITELVREQALERTRDEIPHAVAVVIDELERGSRRRATRIEASLIVETESQKGILVGKGGSMIGAIGAGARPEIERLVGGRVMLDLRVRVRRGWRDDDALLDQAQARARTTPLARTDGGAPARPSTIRPPWRRARMSSRRLSSRRSCARTRRARTSRRCATRRPPCTWRPWPCFPFTSRLRRPGCAAPT
jgi:GTP-binding protein Era